LRGYFNYNDASDYNNGQNTGDALSIVIGSAEVGLGVGMMETGTVVAGASLAAELPSGGTSTITLAGGAVTFVDGAATTAHGLMMAASGTSNLANQKGRVQKNNTHKAESAGKQSNTSNTEKGSLSGIKKALKEAQEKVGGALPKGEAAKKGSPQRGDSKKGYRLDPGHPNRPAGDPERGPHINWWDYTKGKRGAGGSSGAIPID
jgi:hypothetical protein